MSINSFKSFIIDEEDGEKKRKKIVDIIVKTVKKNLIKHDNTDFISFCYEGPSIKKINYEVVVTLDYYKQYLKGMKRAVYITISKETNFHRNTDYLTFDVNSLSDINFMKTLDSIEKYFKKLLEE